MIFKGHKFNPTELDCIKIVYPSDLDYHIFTKVADLISCKILVFMDLSV